MTHHQTDAEFAADLAYIQALANQILEYADRQQLETISNHLHRVTTA